MKLIGYITLLFFSFVNSQTIQEVRTKYINAPQSKEKTTEFNTYLSLFKTATPILQVYKGAGMALQSKVVVSVKEKMRLFKAGATLINQMIESNPTQAEMRVIRLSIQENAPKIVRYNSNISEDKAVLIQQFHRLDPELKKFVKGYIMASPSFSEAEKKALFN